ncbi:hypothetical protein QR680_002458 [Steinernema hermaphroditum]|uniref:PAP-associated domain-containing protein n=1 Tax=Steinernema hermaphroditum TaxID=289476 RepID=A0AA39H4Y1_9BILA|nr:hypothetical protein QR680_002458 [Steinernema hermaphroditum]
MSRIVAYIPDDMVVTSQLSPYSCNDVMAKNISEDVRSDTPREVDQTIDDDRPDIIKKNALSVEIMKYANVKQQTLRQKRQRMKVASCIAQGFKDYCFQLPEHSLHIVGSTMNGYGEPKSDLDLCMHLRVETLSRDQTIECLGHLKRIAKHIPCVDDAEVRHSRVPILHMKLKPPYTHIAVDININNVVTVQNTYMLWLFSKFDWRVSVLVSIVKSWAAVRNFNSASQNTFSSYSLVLMTIHYLQVGVSPPILPSMKNLIANCTQEELLWTVLNTDSIADLVIGFFDYYGNNFNYNEDAISVLHGKKLSRLEVIKGTKNLAQWQCICIQEPFNYTNAAYAVYNEHIFSEIKKELRATHQQLVTNYDLRETLRISTNEYRKIMKTKPVSIARRNADLELQRKYVAIHHREYFLPTNLWIPSSTEFVSDVENRLVSSLFKSDEGDARKQSSKNMERVLYSFVELDKDRYSEIVRNGRG